MPSAFVRAASAVVGVHWVFAHGAGCWQSRMAAAAGILDGGGGSGGRRR